MSKITITKTKENETLTVSAEGRIDTSTSSEFDNTVRPELEGVTQLILNFEKLRYISSSGLRVRLSLHKAMEAKGGKLTVIKPTKIVSEVFNAAGFFKVLSIEQ